MTEADLVIGTSAGSTAAAQITSATPTNCLRTSFPLRPRNDRCSVGAAVDVSVLGPRPTIMERTSRIIGAAKDAADMRRKMGAALLEMDGASDGSRKVDGARPSPLGCHGQDWPEQSLLITAVDADTGEPVVFDRHSGIDLVDAVAASSPVVSLTDRRQAYIDGGYRADVNADLAAGYGRVLIIPPLGDADTEAARVGTASRPQVDELRAAGSRVETIFPDSDSQMPSAWA